MECVCSKMVGKGFLEDINLVLKNNKIINLWALKDFKCMCSKKREEIKIRLFN